MNAAKYAAFRIVEITDIRPQGWIKQFLLNQRTGLTGHQQHGGMPFCDTTVGWAPQVDFLGILSSAPGCQQQEPYFEFTGHPGQGATWVTLEQWGYWLDGVICCGALIEDSSLLQSAGAVIDAILAKADRAGYLGRSSIKNIGQNPKKEHPYLRWPQTVLFRAMMAWHSATGDKRIPIAIQQHYKSETDIDHSLHRNVTNIEAMLWAYSKTGDVALLELATKSYEDYCKHSSSEAASAPSMASDQLPDEHGVSYNELGKLPAILYCYTGREDYLKAVVNGFEKVEKHYELASGLHSSTEYFDGNHALASHETCNISDHTWSLSYLLLATGNSKYADKIEKICFNAGPGAVTEDFTALQYFSCPNQVIADHCSAHTDFKHGSQFMSYRPNPGTECCAANVHRFMPNFASRMWLRKGSDTFVAMLHGPNQLNTSVADQKLSIRAETNYPFEDTIRYQIQSAPKDIAITLQFRVPEWSTAPTLTLNGAIVETTISVGYVSIRQIFKTGDQLDLQVPMKLKIIDRPGGGMVVERGPLVYSLPIHERRERQADIRSTDRFPAWNMYPTSPWNYALAVDRNNLEHSIGVVQKKLNGQNPWASEHAPIQLRVPARRVNNWRILEEKKIECRHYQGALALDSKVETQTIEGDFRFTPPLPSAEEIERSCSNQIETITLIPYGSTRLRITIFPDAS